MSIKAGKLLFTVSRDLRGRFVEHRELTVPGNSRQHLGSHERSSLTCW